LTDQELDQVTGGTQNGLVKIDNTLNNLKILNNSLNNNQVSVAVGAIVASRA